MNTVHKKLQDARLLLQATPLKKSGKNIYAGYDYFELADFIPAVQDICGKTGLFGMISYTSEIASLTIYDVDTDNSVTFTSPMSSAALKGCHEVQNLGAVQTYLRRYLWQTAFELVEHDAMDATTGKEKTVELKVVAKAKPAIPETIVGKEGEWQIKVSLAPEGEVAGWLELITTASALALDMTKKEDDVMQIFKKNKQLFDAVKVQDPEYFKDLMVLFSAAKSKHAKE